MPKGVYKRTEEHKRNISKGKKGLATVFHSKETRKKFSEARKGEKHWNWQGGITKTYHERWIKKNYDRKLYLNTRRRVLKLKASGSHTFQEWEELKKKYDYMCLCCKRQEPEIKLTEDHIIPLIKGGRNDIDNIQPLCKSCNSKKYTNIINFITFIASFRN